MGRHEWSMVALLLWWWRRSWAAGKMVPVPPATAILHSLDDDHSSLRNYFDYYYSDFRAVVVTCWEGNATCVLGPVTALRVDSNNSVRRCNLPSLSCDFVSTTQPTFVCYLTTLANNRASRHSIDSYDDDDDESDPRDFDSHHHHHRVDLDEGGGDWDSGGGSDCCCCDLKPCWTITATASTI